MDNELKINASGTVVFSQRYDGEKGAIHTYLISIPHEKGFSTIRVKHFTTTFFDPFDKDTKVLFSGVLRESRYKDKDTEKWKSNGLEIKCDYMIREVL